MRFLSLVEGKSFHGWNHVHHCSFRFQSRETILGNMINIFFCIFDISISFGIYTVMRFLWGKIYRRNCTKLWCRISQGKLNDTTWSEKLVSKIIFAMRPRRTNMEEDPKVSAQDNYHNHFGNSFQQGFISKRPQEDPCYLTGNQVSRLPSLEKNCD